MAREIAVFFMLSLGILSEGSADFIGKAQLHGEDLPEGCFEWASKEGLVELSGIPVAPLTLKTTLAVKVNDQRCTISINGAKVYKKDEATKIVDADIVLKGTQTNVVVNAVEASGETKDYMYSLEYDDYSKAFEKISPKFKEPWPWGVITPSLGFSYDSYRQSGVDPYSDLNPAYGLDYRVTDLFFDREIIKARAAFIGIPTLTSQAVFEVSGVKASSIEAELAYGRLIPKKWKKISLYALGGIFFGDMTVSQNVFGYKSLLMAEAVAEMMYALKPGNMLMGDLKLALYPGGLQYYFIEVRPGWVRRINESWVLDIRLDFRYLTFGTIYGTLNALTLTPTAGVDLTF